VSRKLIGRTSQIATRQRVYRVPDGLEVDDVDHYEVHRSRVFYDDIVLITFHRTRGLWFNLVTGSAGVLFAVIAFVIGTDETSVGSWVFTFFSAPFLVLVLLRLVLAVDEINVYGRRTSAKLRFWFRKRRARALFDELTATVQRRHDAIARAAAVRDSAMH
jgi:hypothetical protein